jgi:hypothetical protein
MTRAEFCLRSFASTRHHHKSSGGALRRFGLAIAVAGMAVTLSAQSADAATYNYVGNAFTSFSCGLSISGAGTASCSTPWPANPFTSYIATDHVEATLTLDDPLPANLPYQDIRTFAGFQLTMNDGQHTVSTPLTSGQGMFAEVSTDANGNILAWRFLINTGGTLNGGIATYTAPLGFIVDQGTLKCCDPVPGGDFARNSNIPGLWTLDSGTPTPEEAVQNLITVVTDPALNLTNGQVSSFRDKLIKSLASIEAGLNKQAINQLNAFINSVTSEVKKGKLSPTLGTQLIDAAEAIIASLQ